MNRGRLRRVFKLLPRDPTNINTCTMKQTCTITIVAFYSMIPLKTRRKCLKNPLELVSLVCLGIIPQRTERL